MYNLELICKASHKISLGSPVMYYKNRSQRNYPYVKMLGNKSNKYRFGVALTSANKGEEIKIAII